MTDFEIRPLATLAEREACVELQRATWGAEFTELVPPSLLFAVQKVGGIAAGAFDGSGRLLGFVFGFTGTEGGRLVHWSDMVAVRADRQGRGIGRALKEYQRAEVAKLGVREIFWTYDPLVSKNAHLNFNHYGVRGVNYVPDLYGSETRSALHRGVGTDRFVVAWHVKSRRAPAPPGPQGREAPIVNAGTAQGRPAAQACYDGVVYRVEIPRDIAAVQAASLERAGRWRDSTRRAFLALMERGYAVTGFFDDPSADRGYYVLSKK